MNSFASRWLALMALALLCAANAGAAPVAMLLDVKGSAQVTHAGRSAPAQIATSLQEDSRLDLAAGAQVTLVHYARKEQIAIAGPAAVLVTAAGLQSTAAGALQTRRLADDHERVTTKYRGRIVPGAITLRGVRPPTQLAYPRDGETLIDDKRAFAWEPDDPRATYTARLFADDKLVRQVTVTGARIEPGALGTLEPGVVYRLQVAAGDERPAEAAFNLATAAQRDSLKSLQPADPAQVDMWVMYAMALDVEGASTPAREAWAQVAKARPEAAEAVRRMTR